jgi:hypothetical protein
MSKIDNGALRKAAEIPAMPARTWVVTGFRPQPGGAFELTITPNTPAAEAQQAAYAAVPNRFRDKLLSWKLTAPEVAAWRRAAEAERDHAKAVEAARVKAKSLVNAQGDAEQVARQVAEAEALVKVLETRTAAFLKETCRAARDLEGALAAYVRDAAGMLATLVGGQAEGLKREAAQAIGDRLAQAYAGECAARMLAEPAWRAAHVNDLIPELRADAARARAEAAAAAQRRADELKAEATFGTAQQPPAPGGTMRVRTWPNWRQAT